LTSVDILDSFRHFLETRPFPQRRLIILFTSSMLRFRFCSRPREFCPLCGRLWLWEHFFNCRYLDVTPIEDSSTQTLAVITGLVERGKWDIFMHYLRFYLLQWCDLTFDPAFPVHVIESLTDWQCTPGLPSVGSAVCADPPLPRPLSSLLLSG
jgi:hypothetical protein